MAGSRGRQRMPEELRISEEMHGNALAERLMPIPVDNSLRGSLSELSAHSLLLRSLALYEFSLQRMDLGLIFKFIVDFSFRLIYVRQ